MRRPPVFTLVLAFLCGGIAAATVGLAVGFGPSDDDVVGQVRVWGVLLAGLAAGLIGRGVWGWIAASAGASLGSAPFFPGMALEPTTALGLILLTATALAPGYVAGRVVMFVLDNHSARGRMRHEGIAARPGSLPGSTAADPTALWEPAVRAAAPGSLHQPETGAAAVVPMLAVALAGIIVGLLWVVLLSSATDDPGTIALVAFSVGAGAIAGLACGLRGRPSLLLAWVVATVTTSVVATWLTNLATDEEGATYAMIALVMLLVVPAGGGFGLAWVIRMFHAGRPPWRLLATVAIVVLVAIAPLGLLTGPAADFVWLALVLIGGLIVILAVRLREASRGT